MVFDPYSSLAPSSRAAVAAARPGRAGRNRLRLGVGAAVVLLLAALGVAVAVTAIGQVGHSVDVAANPDTDVRPAETGAEPDADPAVPVSTAETAPAVAAEGAVMFVHVLGAVARPGLFEVAAGARVVDVVAAAGGLLPAADQAGVNLARPVTDGEQLYVPQVGEVVAPAAPGRAGDPGTGPTDGAGPDAGLKVNLNTATAADLDTLPRIGPAMAQRILDYRAAEGRFGSIDDLRNVTGIGEKTFAGLKDLITV
jgi:competence protein ComEA